MDAAAITRRIRRRAAVVSALGQYIGIFDLLAYGAATKQRICVYYGSSLVDLIHLSAPSHWTKLCGGGSQVIVVATRSTEHGVETLADVRDMAPHLLVAVWWVAGQPLLISAATRLLLQIPSPPPRPNGLWPATASWHLSGYLGMIGARRSRSMRTSVSSCTKPSHKAIVGQTL